MAVARAELNCEQVDTLFKMRRLSQGLHGIYERRAFDNNADKKRDDLKEKRIIKAINSMVKRNNWSVSIQDDPRGYPLAAYSAEGTCLNSFLR